MVPIIPGSFQTIIISFTHSTMVKISILALIAFASSPLYATAFAPSSSVSSSSLQKPSAAFSSPLFNTQFDPKVISTSGSHERRHTTATRMMAPAAASATATGASALMGVVSGGILGGALHAIAGKFIPSVS